MRHGAAQGFGAFALNTPRSHSNPTRGRRRGQAAARPGRSPGPPALARACLAAHQEPAPRTLAASSRTDCSATPALAATSHHRRHAAAIMRPRRVSLRLQLHDYTLVRLLRLLSHISGGTSSANSNPMPQAGTVRITSQPSNGVPSRVSPVTQASWSPKAMPVSGLW